MTFKLIIKKLKGLLTSEEAKLFDSWLNESSKHRDYFNKVKSNFNTEIKSVRVDKAWSRVESKVQKPVKRLYRPYAAAAAVVITFFSINYYLNSYKENQINENKPSIVNTHSAGTNKAKLTLEDGSEVVLEKGTHFNKRNAHSDGNEIHYDNEESSTVKDVVYNYLTIPRGGQFFIELSDGTQVWLNSESKLKYPVHFIKGKSRQVELIYGEAYFDVSPSTAHNGSKFNVLNNSQSIEVLGTKFNLKANKDDAKVYTTLAEGKVAVKTKSDSKFLLPGDQAVLNTKTNDFNIQQIDAKKEIAWIHGSFVFQKKELKEITKALSRWYDVDFKFENESIANQKFNGELSKKQNLETILSLIKNTNKIQSYEIKGRTIILK